MDSHDLFLFYQKSLYFPPHELISYLFLRMPLTQRSFKPTHRYTYIIYFYKSACLYYQIISHNIKYITNTYKYFPPPNRGKKYVFVVGRHKLRSTNMATNSLQTTMIIGNTRDLRKAATNATASKKYSQRVANLKSSNNPTSLCCCGILDFFFDFLLSDGSLMMFTAQTTDQSVFREN